MKLLCRYFLATLAAAHRRTLDGASASRSRTAGTIRTTVKDISVIRLNHVHCGSASTATAAHFVNNGRQDQALPPSVVPQYQLLVICSCRIRRPGGSTRQPPFSRRR